ncbi:pentapeptide repeat-containing protein [Nostocales cyanobacterium LEGE 11386]|nr:pentapeptide repeat-containing protein [Nostocales cyanobacterium LEGE 11386]
MPKNSYKNNLRGYNFKGTNLEHKDFINADLRKANFTGADLREANFTGADLREAKFDSANLEKANFSEAKFGLQFHWIIIYLSFSFLLVIIVGIILAILANIVGSAISDAVIKITKEPNYKNENILYLATLLASLINFIILVIFRKVIISISTLGITITLIIILAFFKEILYKGETANITFLIIIYLLIVSIFLIAISVQSLVFNFIKIIAGNKILIISIFVTLAVTIYVSQAAIFTELPSADKNFGMVLSTAVYQVFLVCFIAWKAIGGSQEWAWPYKLAIAIAAIKGTSFYKANLTDSDFNNANVKHIDLREAILTRTYWVGVQGIETAQLDRNYYLNQLEVRQLVIEKVLEYKDFYNLNLQGINLQGLDLTDFNFIDSDLRQSKLEGVKLFNTKLVRTKLGEANLNNADITGAYIEEWGVTKTTKIDNIKCDYIYLRLETKKDRDPHRMPPSNEGNFQPNGFRDFLKSVLDTLKIYHDQEINSKVAIQVLKAMTKKYPEVKLEVIGIEHNKDNKKSIRLKVDGDINYDQFEKEYGSIYEETLDIYDSHGSIPNTVAMAADFIEAVNKNPSQKIYNESIVIEGGEVKMSIDQSRQQNINTGGGNFNNSGIGAFNIGDITGTVTNSINQLPASQQPDKPGIKELLQQLQSAIEAETNLNIDDKTEALEQVKALAEAGKKPQDGSLQKAAKTAVKILKGTITGLPSAAQLVTEFNNVLPLILKNLGLG